MSESIDQAGFYRLIEQAQEIYLPGCGGFSELFAQWLSDNPKCASNSRFTGVYIPGVNRTDLAAFTATSRMRVFFMSSDFRQSYQQNKIDYLPMSYTRIYRYLQQCRFDICLIQISPPDEQGHCSLGIASDFSPAVFEQSKVIVAHINPDMPRTNGPSIAFSKIHYYVEQPYPLLAYPDEEPNSLLTQVAHNVAQIIEHGATLQFGLGKLQTAIFRQLNHHRDLTVHSGMISDSLLTLVENGNLNDIANKPAITTGVALGTESLYQWLANNPQVEFKSVNLTHDLRELAKYDKFTSINSALEIDLMGQLNVDTIGGQQISGSGGLTDFIRGSQYSEGGKSIIAFPSVYGKNMSSRIIGHLNKKNLCTLSRIDLDYVVTENGIADLKYLNVAQQADALIDIAHQSHRDSLKKIRDLK